jgi:hypothetical protein
MNLVKGIASHPQVLGNDNEEDVMQMGSAAEENRVILTDVMKTLERRFSMGFDQA